MNRSLTFPTPIWSDKFEDIDNDKLAKVILEEQSEGNGIELSPLDGWRTNSQDIFKHKDFQPLLNNITRRSEDILKEFDINPKYKLGGGLGWVYITEMGGWHPPHCHPDGFLSCVYYIKVPEDSNSHIVFDDPRVQTSMLNEQDTFLNTNVLNHSRIPINPEEGTFMAFPSWFNHFVSPSMSDKKRIMITLNFPLDER